jgi:deoxyadenosine/deoxycytidine kinase
MPYQVIERPDQLPAVVPGCCAFVESIIGGGKTTFCENVGPRLNFRVFKEPLDHRLLDRFYKDKAKYAFHFQIHVLQKRIGIQMLAACEALYSDTYDGAMVDRSIFGDVPFAKMHSQQGNIEALDWITYQLGHMNMKFMIWPPTVLIYLAVEPEIALERIRKRDREYERDMNLEYLVELRKYYDEMVEEAQSGKWPWGHAIKVHYVDWNPATTDEAAWAAVAASLKRRMETMKAESI